MISTYRPDLYSHQKQALDYIVEKNFKAGIFYEMGLGKSRISLEAYKLIKQIEKACKMIVLCPKSIIVTSWCSDALKYADNFSVCNTRVDKYTDQDIIIFNYESLLFTQGKLFNDLTNGPCLLVCDESQRLKNRQAKITKFITKHKKLFRGVLLLSGTPAPNNELEYFSQINLISDFYPNFYAYQARYFHMIRGNQVVPCGYNTGAMCSQGFKIKLKEALRDELYSQIGRVAITAKKADCIDLPEKIFQTRIIEMSSEQKKTYKELDKELYTELKSGTEIAISLAIVKLMKLRQVTSGFVYDTATNTAHDVSMVKLNELIDTLEEIGEQQVVIFAQFRYEISKIVDTIRALGKTVDFLSGESDDRDTTIKLFNNKDVQYLVCHPRTAGIGLNLQSNCSNMVWYSLSYSYAEYAQACDRIHRIGQKLSCNYIHLICKDSIDEILLNVIDTKGDAQDAIFEYLKEVK